MRVDSPSHLVTHSTMLCFTVSCSLLTKVGISHRDECLLSGDCGEGDDHLNAILNMATPPPPLAEFVMLYTPLAEFVMLYNVLTPPPPPTSRVCNTATPPPLAEFVMLYTPLAEFVMLYNVLTPPP